ncbi:uncharacterized protein LOC134233591 [Saccostrea cucullata]|uniref:uncharacterized protein LOC134233591 n=1 Tax=Saccostrea cuccullata TaxID=36930 RepID=UPI002ED51A53
MFRDRILAELDDQGFSVVEGVLSEEDCRRYSDEFKDWVHQYKDNNKTFGSFESLVQSYRIGHFHASWAVRLKVKHVFSELWETEKLLSSVDGVAVSPPPEMMPDRPKFRTKKTFLHLDQGSKRQGLHAYQSGVYLEESSDSDHCFRVLKGSHKLIKDFYDNFSLAARQSSAFEYYELTQEEIDWYKDRGCPATTVPVPRGGMVLWDSRLVHDNARPVEGRPRSDRWRHVVFVCMTPAKWAKQSDIKIKREAYEHLLMTTHWPSQGVSTFPEYHPTGREGIRELTELPEIAKQREVRLLMGVDEYEFNDGASIGPKEPVWT